MTELLGYRSSDTQAKVWCPWCRVWHFHGWGNGHRSAHCACRLSPFRDTGYDVVITDETPPPQRSSRRTQICCSTNGDGCTNCPAARGVQKLRSHITWLCSACEYAIADGDGYLEVSLRDAGAIEVEMQAWEERESDTGFVDGAEFILGYPDPARWQAWHAFCDPRPDESSYWYAIARCRTAEQMLAHLAHLTSKRWFDATDITFVVNAFLFALNSDGRLLLKRNLEGARASVRREIEDELLAKGISA